MAQRSAQIVTTLKVSNLKTYETLAIGFDVEVWTSTTPTSPGGSKDTLFASRFIGGSKYGILFKSSEHIFTGVVKENYYIARYRIVRVDGLVSTWYEEEELIGDTDYENPEGSPTVSITSKSVASSNGAIVAQLTIDNIPSDHKEIHWYVRDSTDSIVKTTIPEHITTDVDIVSGDGTVVLRLPILGNKYIYAILVDASRNKFLTGGYATEIGTVAALTVPSAATLTYSDGVIKALTSYNFTNNPPTYTDFDVIKLEFNVSRDGGTTWVVHEVFRPDDATGATDIKKEIVAEGGITFTWRVRAVNSIGMVTAYSSNASIVCPFANAAIDDDTTALIPFSKGVGSTDGLYPSNSPQVVMRNDGRYGGCVEIAEIPSDVLDWASQPNLIEDYNMEGGLDKWKAWALSFDGVDDKAVVTDNPNLDMDTNDFTLMCEFKTEATAAGYLISKREEGVGGKGYNLLMLADGKIRTQIDDDVAVSQMDSPNSYNDGLSHKAIILWDRSGTAIMYIDGVPVQTVDASTAQLTIANGKNFTIGINSNDESGTPFEGEIFDTRIFNRILSAAEVLYYSKGYPTKWVDKGANQTELVTNGDFTGGTTGWGLTGTTAYGTNNINITGNSGTNSIYQTGFSVPAKKLMRVTYEVVSNTLVGSGRMKLGITNALEMFGGTVLNTTVGTHSIGVETDGGTWFAIGITSGYTSGVITLDNFSLILTGEVVHYDFREGAGSYLMDKSGNGLTASITGATWVTDSELAKSSLQAYRESESLKLANSRTNFEVDLPARVIGSELVTNGNFDVTTGWATTDCTILSVPGGQAGNCLEITRTAGNFQQAYRTLALTVGNLYRLTAYVKSGTSGDEAYRVTVEGAGTNISLEGNSSNAWVKATVIFEATEVAPAIKIRKNTVTAGTMLFDTVSVVEVEYQSAFLYSQMSFLPTRGSDLVSNGGFDTNITGWTAADATLASISGGEFGNCCEITRSADTQTTYQSITGLTIENFYRVRIYVKDGTQTGLVNTLAIGTTIGGTEVASKNVTTTPTWVLHAIVFEATATSHYINYNSVITTASATTLLDSVTFHEINTLDIGIEGYKVLKGTASGFLPDELEDTTLNQFADVSAGDWVHNLTDDTWGQVDSSGSNSELTPNWGMFPSGDEDYEVFVLAKSSGYVSHFSQDGNDGWGNKSMQVVTGQYDNRLIVSVSKNPNDQSVSSFLDFTHLLKQNDDGLVGHWKLSRRDGARDLSGNGNHGTVSGAVYADDQNSVVDGALDFDGVGDVVTIVDSSMQITGALTIEVWVKSNGTPTGSDSGIVTNDSYDYALTHHTTGYIYFYINGGGNYINYAMSADVWHHVVGVFDGTTGAKSMIIYLDGVEVNSKTSSSATIGSPVATLKIGDGNTNYKGFIAGVRLHNRDLSATEVTALYDGTKELYTSNSIEYLKQGGVPLQLSSDFNKDERMIEYPTSGIINLSTLSMSFNVSLLKYTSSTGYLFKHTTTTDDRLYIYQINGDGSLYIRLGSTAATDTGQNLILNKWYKIALTIDGTNYKVMLDGVLIKSGTYSGLSNLDTEFIIGAYTSGTQWGNCLIENFRIDKVVKTEEQIRAFHELQVPFFDPDPNTSPAPVISFSNTQNVYSVSPKDNLQQQGTVKITNGSATVNGTGTEFTKMFRANEKMQFLGTSSGDVVYVVSSITNDTTLVLTSNVVEVTAAGLDYKNFTWEKIVDTVEPLKFLKKVKKFN